MLKHGSEIKLWTLGRFCQRGCGRWGACVNVSLYSVCMWSGVFHRHTDAPWLIEVLVILLLSFPSYLSFYTSVCLSPSLCHYVYPSTACRPPSGKLSIHGASQHFEKVQSCKPKRLREAVHTEASMWVSSFATITPACPALMLPAGCGGRYQRVITPEGEKVPQSSPGVQQAQRWSLAALCSLTDISLSIQGCAVDCAGTALTF